MTKIGLVGQNGSGKSTAAQFFIDHGFGLVSLSDIVRDVVRKKGLSCDRDTLTATANDLKTQDGLDVLAVRALAMANEHHYPHVVFDSIRHPKEVAYLKSHDTVIIGIQVPLDIRYERIQSRQHETDFVDFDTFKAQDQREQEGTSVGQSLQECFSLCDTLIYNQGSLEELYAQLLPYCGSKKVLES